jgi:hypothetical protein
MYQGSVVGSVTAMLGWAVESESETLASLLRSARDQRLLYQPDLGGGYVPRVS